MTSVYKPLSAHQAQQDGLPATRIFNAHDYDDKPRFCIVYGILKECSKILYVKLQPKAKKPTINAFILYSALKKFILLAFL